MLLSLSPRASPENEENYQNFSRTAEKNYL